MLNKKDLRDLIETTILDIKLTGAVVEKDYYVTQVIHALSNIQIKNNENFSRSRLIKELKEFRAQIKSSLVISGLTTIEDAARNEGKYQRIILKYPHTYPISPTLRPDLLLEFTLSEIRLSVEDLSVKTIIEKVLKEMSLFTSPQIPCISVDE